MMTKIKYAISFILGALAASMIWALIEYWGNATISPIMIVGATTTGILIVIAILNFLVTHWGDK